MLLWLHLQAQISFARIHRAQIKTTNQSTRKIWRSVSPAHAGGSSAFPRMLSFGQAQYLQWEDAMEDKQPQQRPSNEKTAHPSFANNSLQDKDK